MDPRSTQGILSRGQNIYNSVGYGSRAGKPSIDLAATAKSLIPNTMANVNYAEVAKKWLQHQPSLG